MRSARAGHRATETAPGSVPCRWSAGCSLAGQAQCCLGDGGEQLQRYVGPARTAEAVHAVTHPRQCHLDVCQRAPGAAHHQGIHLANCCSGFLVSVPCSGSGTTSGFELGELFAAESELLLQSASQGRQVRRETADVLPLSREVLVMAAWFRHSGSPACDELTHPCCPLQHDQRGHRTRFRRGRGRRSWHLPECSPAIRLGRGCFRPTTRRFFAWVRHVLGRPRLVTVGGW